MHGIFQYQVPGQKAQVNQVQSGPKPSSQDGVSQFKGRGAQPPSFNKEIFSQILLLLTQLLEQITGSQNGGSLSPDRPDVTTLAIGEEDGGTPPPVDGPPDITTFALGEEDGGTPPPVDGPPDITTFALGEEDGGTPPPVDGLPDATTKALGEEDGGMTPPDNGPPDLTTLAIGEEDGGLPPPDIKY